MDISEGAGNVQPACWIQPLEKSSGPRYVQIVKLIEDAIHSGALPVGAQLPPQRLLAQTLGVDLTTVTRAYGQARSQGLISSVGGRGTFVLDTSQAPQSNWVDLAMNTSPQPADGSIVSKLHQGLAQVLAHQPIDALSRYHKADLNRSVLQAAQAWLKPTLADMNTQSLVLSEGAQSAIFAILLSSTCRGDVVLCEPLTYPGFLNATRSLGLQVVGLQEDAHGVLPEAIERAVREQGARVLYLNPTVQNPTTRTMPLARRQEIAQLVERLGITLIEDDPYRCLLSEVPPPIAALNGGRNVYYVTTLSKCLSPALRTAFVIAPRGHDGSDIEQQLRAFSMGGSPLLLALVAYWFRTGQAEQLVAEVRREARSRQTLLRAILPPVYHTHPGSLHVWLPLGERWDQRLFVHALAASNIGVASAEQFSVQAHPDNAVRISLGGATDQSELARALKVVAALLNQPSPKVREAII